MGVKQSTRLLGSVEIGKDTIIRKIEANERMVWMQFLEDLTDNGTIGFSLKLANVVQDGPVLILTAGFSLASGPQYTYYAAKDNSRSFYAEELCSHDMVVNYLNKSLIVSQLPQMYEAMQSQREIGLLELAVMYERVLLLPNTSRDKSQSLNKLGDIYSRLHSAREKDLYQAVDAYRDAVRVATHGMHDKWEIADYLSDMGISLSRRFECLGNVSDIDEAVLTFRNAVQLTSYDNPNKALSFDNLGRALMYRFNHLGNVSDINESVQLFSDAVRLTPVDDPEQFFSLNHLGRALMYRFTRLGNLNDINESIVMLQEAVRLIPDWHPERAAQLDDLGGALGYRFKYLGNLSDLEKSIQLQQDAVKLTPDGHPDRAQTLNNFSSSLARHFWHVGNVNDIDNSIIMKQEVLDLTPDGHPSKPGYMKDLANSLLYRFLRLAKHSDIDKSVLLLQNAVQLTPDDYRGKPGYFNMLGASLQSRFVVLGKLSDINESILMLQNAVQLIPDDHPEKPRFLNDLGTAFLHRFRYFGNLNDINETVLIFEDVVKLAPDSHPDRSLWLNNLGGSLSDRFSRLHNISDLEKCILMFQNSVKLIPDNHPAKPQLLNNLGGSLIQHFQHAGHISDIEQSIQVLKDAVKLTPDDHPIKPSQLGNLGNSLLCRFHCLGNISDIDESILIVQDAVKLSPDNHPHKPGLLETLGNVWFHRFEQLHINQDASQALDCYSSAAQAATGPASTRFSASSQWVFLAEKIGHESCLEAYSTVLTLLPQLAWLGSPVPDRHFHIRKAGALVRQAAVATIEQDDFSTAIEWLEQGRAVIWGQLLNLRAPIDDLKISHPDLGLQLEHLSSQLEGATTQSTLVQPLSGPYSAASQPLDYHRLAEKREQLLTSIRRLPGFEQFLLPRPLTQLTKAAKWGPVIMLNASERRCDALVLMSGLSDDILHIPLPDVSLAKAMALHKILKDLLKGCIPTADRLLDSSENTDWKRLGIYFVSTETGQPYKDILVEWSRIVLSLLWHWVVKPIVEGLALTVSDSHRTLNHYNLPPLRLVSLVEYGGVQLAFFHSFHFMLQETTHRMHHWSQD